MNANQELLRLALRLYSFPNNDRNWVLDRMTEDERISTSTLLKHFKAQSITRNYDIIQAALEHSINPVSPSVADYSEELDEESCYINAQPVGKIIEAIAAEPDYIISYILLLTKWSWSRDFENYLIKENKSHLVKKHKPVSEEIPATLKKSLLSAFYNKLCSLNTSLN